VDVFNCRGPSSGAFRQGLRSLPRCGPDGPPRRRSPRRKRRDLDPYQVAYLAGGAKGAVNARIVASSKTRCSRAPNERAFSPRRRSARRARLERAVHERRARQVRVATPRGSGIPRRLVVAVRGKAAIEAARCPAPRVAASSTRRHRLLARAAGAIVFAATSSADQGRGRRLAREAGPLPRRPVALSLAIDRLPRVGVLRSRRDGPRAARSENAGSRWRRAGRDRRHDLALARRSSGWGCRQPPGRAPEDSRRRRGGAATASARAAGAFRAAGAARGVRRGGGCGGWGGG